MRVFGLIAGQDWTLVGPPTDLDPWNAHVPPPQQPVARLALTSLDTSRGNTRMRVAIHTLGTRGDVQPYLALALGLKAAGHDVLIAAPSQFEAFVGTRGIAFAHLPGEFLALMETPERLASSAST